MGEQQSSTWIHKGIASITRIGRANVPPVASAGGANPLREIFTDLIAFVIFFKSSCDKQPPDQNELREKILALAIAQEERVKAAGISADSFREARFAVFSWVDEMILTSTWPHRTRWQHLMLSYYKTFNAGEDFFARLQNLPPHANDVREIYYLCLSLGFLGQYAFADGPSEVKKLKQALYNQLSGKQGDIRRNYGLLFPEAYQKAVTAARAPDRAKFFWYVVALSTPVVLFIVYFALLRYQADQLIAKIARVEQAPPAAAAIKKSWATSLVEELRGKGVRATEEPDGVRITLATLLFTSGSAQLSIQAQPQINDIVVTVKRYAPDNIIRVEGHASREREADEPRNRKLSEERAHTVAEMFTRSGFRSDRIFAQGLGSTKPLATNDTEQGRSQNRRVEITVRK
jgi:type VI secretion system protein ImpK